MKKFDLKEFFNSFIGGFKEIFTNKQYIKLIVVMVLVLFLVLFILMGGLASCGCQGIVRCDGCGSSDSGDGEQFEITAETLFDGTTPAAATISDEFAGIAATIYYPAEVCSYTDVEGDMWANWCGDLAVYADGKFSIQPSFDYISDNYNEDGSSCASFDEVRAAFKARYGGDPKTYGDLKLGKNDGFWFVYGGYTTAKFPVPDTNLVLDVYLIPADLDQNAADAADKASALMQDEELLSILGTLQITAIDAIPDASTAIFYKDQADNTGEIIQQGGDNSDASETPDVPGEIYDTGSFTVLVPEDWKAFPKKDIWSEDDAIDPSGLQIAKGAESEWDLFSVPYVDVIYYGVDDTLMTPSMEWYDNAEELESFTAGEFTWNGFVAESLMGGQNIILWTDPVNDIEYQANVFDPDAGSISVDDEGLQAILASLKAN